MFVIIDNTAHAPFR